MFSHLVRASRPLFLLGGALVYALGAGVARYLGVRIDWGVYFLGQAWVSLLQLSAQFLNEYYDAAQDRENPNRTPFTGGSGAVGPDGLPRNAVLAIALGCLAVLASLTVVMMAQLRISPALVILMMVSFLGAFFYSVPPVRLSSSGYGELTTSILVANLVPAFAYLLQTNEFHRLLAMSTFPLTLLHLSMMMAFELPDYLPDLKNNKQTLMIRIGWQRGMNLHNILILFAFLLLGLAWAFGLPASIVIPVFLTLPLGVFQIWQMYRIADGAPPNWTLLTLTAVAIFVLPTYLITFAFWTR